MKFLTTEQKKFYNDNGYVVLDILTNEEISELSEDFDRIFEAKDGANLEATWQGDWKTDKKKNVIILLFCKIYILNYFFYALIF